MTKPKGRSRLQKAQALGNLTCINSSNNENSAPPGLGLQDSLSAAELFAARAELNQQRERSMDYERRFRNSQWQLGRARASNSRVLEQLSAAQSESAVKLEQAAVTNNQLATIIESAEELAHLQATELSDTRDLLSQAETHTKGLNKKINKLRMRSDRAADSKAKAVEKAVSQVSTATHTYNLKQKGAVTDEARSMVRDLVQLGVPVENVNNVVHVVSEPLGVTVCGDISKRTVSRAVLEGGIAAKIQIAHEAHNAKSGLFLFLLCVFLISLLYTGRSYNCS
jgi:hypothetical protein